jgi:DNA-binding NarL/FixJ family response regulator
MVGVRQSVKLRVAVQLQNRTLREVVAAYLDGESDIQTVGTTAAWAELPRLCELRNPDVVVFETASEQGDPRRLVVGLRAHHPRLRLVGLYDNPDAEMAGRLQCAGVGRLVSLSSGIGALLAAVRSPLPAQADGQDARGLRGHAGLLTDRELRTLHLISSGYTLEQIAAALGITPRTVENYKRRIFAKLDARGQAHAAAYAVRYGLLPVRATAGPRPVQIPAADFPPVCLLRGTAGPLAEQAAGLLMNDGVPLIHDLGAGPVNTDHPAWHVRGSLVVTVVDPGSADWTVLADLPCRIIVVLTQDPAQSVLADSLLRGADAIITADRLVDTLVPAFHLVAQGYMLVDAGQARKFIGAAYARLAHMRPFVPLELTRREHQILGSIEQGQSVKQTARSLGISVKTVESLQSRLFRKLGTRSRAEALVVAHGLGLIPPDGQQQQQHHQVNGVEKRPVTG